jgi:hypothetical protein
MIKPFVLSVFGAVLVTAALHVHADTLPRTSAPEGAKAYIVSPADGATVKSPVTVIFGLEGMGVAPAGSETPNTGHHHLLVDMDVPKDLSQPLGADVKHFGGGQTQVQLELAPGKHTLQLLLGDKLHIPHQPPIMSEKITITVE